MSDRYAVIGNPVAHSKSPEIHTLFARQTGQDMEYTRLLAPLDGFAATVKRFVGENGCGLNVTVPFKFDAFDLSTCLSDRARTAGAVNTLRFEGDVVVGDNTDGAGLVADITQNAGVSLSSSRILLLGAGGAASGVMLPLLEQKPELVHIANRNESRAKEMAARFAAYGPVRASGYGSLDQTFDVVINATSTGLQHTRPPVPAAVFRERTLALDMVYADEPTVFMTFAQQSGAAVRDGFGMLVEQAAESFYVWRGVRPDTGPVFSFFGR